MDPRPTNDMEELSKKLEAADMRRYRDLESYQQLLGVDIRGLAINTVKAKGKFVWYDMCCGDFEAGKYLMYSLTQESTSMAMVAKKIQAKGIDLVTPVRGDYRSSDTTITFGDAVNFPIPSDIDLVTCLQGLQHVQGFQGKGLEAIEHWYNNLPKGALLAFDYPLGKLSQEGLDNIKRQLGDSVSVTTRGNFTDRLLVVNIKKSDVKALMIS